MASEKRPAQDDPASTYLVKRPNLGSSTGLLTRTSGSDGPASLELSVSRLAEWYPRYSTRKLHQLTSNVHQVFRASGLQPTVTELSGHTGEVFSAKFDPTGRLIASCSMDRRICRHVPVLGYGERGRVELTMGLMRWTTVLWNRDRDYENYGVLSGHRAAVLDLQW